MITFFLFILYPSYIDFDGGTSLLSAETKCRLCSNVMGECRHQICNQIPCLNLPNPQQNVKSFENSAAYFSQLTHSIVNGLKSLISLDIFGDFALFHGFNAFRSLGHSLDKFYPNDALSYQQLFQDWQLSQQSQVLCALVKPTLVVIDLIRL